MRTFALALFTSLLIACARSVSPGGDGSTSTVDAGDSSITDIAARDVLRIDVQGIPCGDSGVCGAGTICARGRCAGCCDLPPSCVPIPTGCSGALACGCFATDPCGGCTRCQSVGADGVLCGNCMCACAAPWTPIETPSGLRSIAELQVGDLVYSMDHGVRVIVPIERTIRRPVAHHAVVHMTLANGSVLEISGRHPTADGRALESLQPGDHLGAVEVLSVETLAYSEPFTYDILPASDTGAYFASGALIGSTLFHRE